MVRSVNFGFLARHDAQLDRLGALAERYFAEDANTCIIKLRQFAELLLIPLDELLKRERQALGVHVVQDHAIGDLEQKSRRLLLRPLARIGVGHVEAEIDDHFVGRRVNALGVGVMGF